VPLWSNRGLIGVLLLGDKRDGSLYTQEEIEIARASGERLIDTLAAAEMARRLMALQRQRLAESHLLDRRTRRVLHDDILPQLHTAILSLSATQPDAVAPLADAHRQLATLLREMPADPAPDLARLGLAGALRQVIEHELEGAFTQVNWTVEPEAQREVQAIPAHALEVLFYAAREVLRNAAHHARAGDEARRLHLGVAISWRNGLEIRIEDDGVGLALAGPGSAGSRQGLALHSTMMAVIGGSLAIESEPGAYTRATLSLPRVAW
jgi:signal transduction histidine kinase